MLNGVPMAWLYAKRFDWMCFPIMSLMRKTKHTYSLKVCLVLTNTKHNSGTASWNAPRYIYLQIRVWYQLYGFCRGNYSNKQTNETLSRRRAPKNPIKKYIWEQKIEDKLLSRDATHGTNYYEQYWRKKAGVKERRQRMGNGGAHRTVACCVIL